MSASPDDATRLAAAFAADASDAAHPGEAGAGAAALAEAAVAWWAAIAAALAPVIGERGVAALFARCRREVAARHAWLDDGAGALLPPRLDAAALRPLLAARPRHEALAVQCALLAAFETLLTSLLGEPLTLQLLPSAGVRVAADPSGPPPPPAPSVPPSADPPSVTPPSAASPDAPAASVPSAAPASSPPTLDDLSR